MFAVIGIVLVFGAVIGGYLMEHGSLMVLVQPAELVVIGGAALGALIVGNPLHVLKAIVSHLLGLLKPHSMTKQKYLETLRMLYTLFNNARKNGDQALETEVENPETGPSFQTYPAFLKDKVATAYVCDTIRMCLMGGSPHDLEALMEIDADTQAEESNEPASALQSVSDALPGFGIVAAVLGVVITMQSLGGPPEEIGHKVAAALVGTFLGILLSYGVVGPLASVIAKENDAHHQYLACLRSAVIAYAKGCSPLMSVEYGRRSIVTRIRPAFADLEQAVRSGGGEGAAQKAA